jgi:hypothetical protein
MSNSSFFSGTGVTATQTTAIETSVAGATQSATDAAASALLASQKADIATTKSNDATAASSTSVSAKDAALAAKLLAQAALSSATTQANNSSTSASASNTRANAAAVSAAASSTSAGASETKANEAATSAQLASDKAAIAVTAANSTAGSAAAATTSANASTAAKNAAEQAEQEAEAAETVSLAQAALALSRAEWASESATLALGYKNQAQGFANSMGGSVSAASGSAIAAAASASISSASKDAALAALDSFDDRYLGQKSSDPNADNDGDALAAGALYFNTTSDVMKVYEGSSWVAAYASLSGALIATSNLSDVANAGTARTNLGLAIGTNVQAYSSVLAATTASYTSAEESKLSGIETGATADQTGAQIKAAYEAESNAFTDAQFTKLAGIEASATADQTNAEIKAAVEAATDSNVFTDADHSKLNAIEASSDVTDTANVTAAGALMDSEVTNLSQVKAFDTTDYATAAQGTLAASAVQPNDSAALKELDLAAIATDISDTAVDVFVYRTADDSDGGKWRKRTQHTSWYNEALGTSTRGSRKEFPAVAVIVVENTKLTIYDGDDPDMPMWIVFDSNTQDMLGGVHASGGAYFKKVTMFNGEVHVATNSGYSPYYFAVNFISEKARMISHENQYCMNGSISQRNDGLSGYVDISGGLVFLYCVDVAVTVLPNAPIDKNTGLPVPTVAVATGGGVSVIKDNGNIVDIKYVAHTSVGSVHFNSQNHLLFSVGASNKQNIKVHFTIPSSDQHNSQAGYQSSQEDLQYGNSSVTHDISVHPSVHSFTDIAEGALGSNTNLVLIDKNNTDASYLTNFITSDHQTGWQVGDIKLATLSDTDDTNVTGAELVTNGTFASNVNNWTDGTGVASYYSTDSAMKVVQGSGTGFVYQAITTVVGKTYTLSFSAKGGNTTAVAFFVGTTSTGGTILSRTGITVDTSNYRTITGTFVATATTTYIRLSPWASATNFAYFDNISVRIAEPDRSVNGNGVQVFGTVTKTAVASGADLVGYGPFSNANFLKQPYNSDLDFGTGDFCIMGWFKLNSNNSSSRMIYRQQDAGNRWTIYSNGQELWFYQNDGTATYSQMSGTHSLGTWNHFVLRRTDTLTDFALNGEVRANTTDHPGTAGARDATFNGTLCLGDDPNTTSGTTGSWLGSLALIRISATAPSPEQIAKIYNDEKHLFQAGAQATLYGASDAVTALAHDDATDLLHVGTSAGRSVFQGLRRVENTTDAVGTTISASNGLVAED